VQCGLIFDDAKAQELKIESILCRRRQGHREERTIDMRKTCMPSASTERMSHTLIGGGMEISVVVPGAAGTYCGTRFSWAGIISDATWGEHHLFGPWRSCSPGR
jgi:hypothetical protein